jgi:hypothetical protein
LVGPAFYGPERTIGEGTVKKLLVIGGALAGVAFLARRAACRMGTFDMAACIEAMPDSAPPKWMFTNISAIRENTERILERLDQEPSPPVREDAPEDVAAGAHA